MKEVLDLLEIKLCQRETGSKLVYLEMFNKPLLHYCGTIYTLHNEERYMHLYLVSDENIEIGDWYYYKDKDGYEHIYNRNKDDNTYIHGKKIIYSTEELDGVKLLYDDFIANYIDNYNINNKWKYMIYHKNIELLENINNLDINEVIQVKMNMKNIKKIDIKETICSNHIINMFKNKGYILSENTTYNQILEWLRLNNIFVEITYGKDHIDVWYDYDIFSLIKPRKDDLLGEDDIEYENDVDEKWLNYDTTYESMIDSKYAITDKDSYKTPDLAKQAAIKYILKYIL